VQIIVVLFSSFLIFLVDGDSHSKHGHGSSDSDSESTENTRTASTALYFLLSPWSLLFFCIIGGTCVCSLYYKCRVKFARRNVTQGQDQGVEVNQDNGGVDEEALRVMPTEKYQNPSVDLEESHQRHDDCSICLVEFNINDEIQRLQCAHIFHPQCIRVWLAKHRDCPLCKQKFDNFGNVIDLSPTFVQDLYEDEEHKENSAIHSH